MFSWLTSCYPWWNVYIFLYCENGTIGLPCWKIDLAKPTVRNNHLWGWKLRTNIWNAYMKNLITYQFQTVQYLKSALSSENYLNKVLKNKCLINLWTLSCRVSYLLSICFGLFINCFLLKLFINSLYNLHIPRTFPVKW